MKEFRWPLVSRPVDAPIERRLLAGATHRARADRLIAVSRVVLAGLSLLAARLDPFEPARSASLVSSVLVVYLVWSVLTAAMAWFGSSAPSWLFASHAIDIGMFFLLVSLTEGSSSPFFGFFVFALVSATLCWGWRGTAVTAIVVLSLYVGLGVHAIQFLHGEGFDLGSFLTRGSFLTVVALLVGYLGAHEGQLRVDLLRLLDQPEGLSDKTTTVVGQSLAQAGPLLRAARALFVWEENEEPWVRWGVWSPDGTQFDRAAPGSFEPLVAESLAEVTFACRARDAKRPFTRVRTVAGAQRWSGPLLHPALRERFAVRAALSAPVSGGAVRGRLFVFEPRRGGADDLVLAELFARRMSARLERLDFLRDLQVEARNELSARFGRDLHDGVIQSLTAASLRLEAAQRLLPPEAPAGQVIREVEQLLGDEQEDLRAFIRQARPSGIHPSPTLVPLGDRLRDLVQRIAGRWRLHVEVTCVAGVSELQGLLAHEVDRIAHEALVNAARHGGATSARLELEVVESGLHLVIADNGRGFPFVGRYDLVTLTERKLGPVMLKQRVTTLHGDLVIESSATGARLDIRLPLVNGV